MIFVARNDSNKPPGFDQRSALLQREFAQARSVDPSITISKFWDKIRRDLQEDAQALFNVFSGKCAFCEAKMAHTSSPHIEHYHPKSKYEALVFLWSNWLLSCGLCNQHKWRHFPMCGELPCLVNPTTEDPTQHIDFVDEHATGLTRRGIETINLLKLDRTPLEEDRSRWLMQIDSLLLLVIHPESYHAARRLLIWSMQKDAPYSAMVRQYLTQKCPKLAKPRTPHPHIAIDDYYEEFKQVLERYAGLLQDIE